MAPRLRLIQDIPAFDVKAEAARLVAAYRAAHVPEPAFDEPTPDPYETLDVVEALHRLCEQVGGARVEHLLRFVQSARGER